jgi:TRAP-type mannitol/chloroaromatic compound transport system permease small subunit
MTTSSFPTLEWIIKRIDGFTDFTGRSIAWITGIMVIITCIVVVLRHVFSIGSIGLQESVTYMHALVFMMGAAYALKTGDHVRVDILYRRFSPMTKAWIDALGSLLFALPVMLFIGFGSWDFVKESWRIGEGSNDSGGLAGVYLLKTLLLIMAVCVSLQAVAELLRNLLILMLPSKEASS